MPSILDPSTPAASSSPGQGDDEIRALKQFIADVFGLPTSPNQITVPMGSLTVDGNYTYTKGIVLPDMGIDPAIAGQLARRALLAKYFDGFAVRVNQVLERSGQGAFPNPSSTAVETPFYTQTIRGGTLGTTNRVDAKLLFRVGLLAGSTIQLLFYFGGQGTLDLGIGNSSAGTVGLTLCPVTISIWGNGAANLQILSAESKITATSSAFVNPFSSVMTNIAGVLPITADSTVDQSLQMNILFSSSSVSNVCDCLGSVMTVRG